MKKTAVINEAIAHVTQALDLLDSVGETTAAPYLDSALQRLLRRDLNVSGTGSDTVQ